MRSTFAGLNTMVRGIQGNQVSLETVGHNITNASTEGYSRQSVNLTTTPAQAYHTAYGISFVGSGDETRAITRARDVFADKQYWAESSNKGYYEVRQKNYDKIEAVFNDSKQTGIQNMMEKFFKAWQDLSTQASTSSTRVTVAEKGRNLAAGIKMGAAHLQAQINALYAQERSDVMTFNSITGQIVELNKKILQAEAAGGFANDLRDSRDLLVDKLSKYTNLSVTEDENKQYLVVSNGMTLINGDHRMTLEMSDPIYNKDYGINDYNLVIKEAGISYQPISGSFKGLMGAIQENKDYINRLANISGFLLTTFNDIHQQGAGINGTDGGFRDAIAGGTSITVATDAAGKQTAGGKPYAGPTFGINFYGNNDTKYTWDADKQAVTAQRFKLGSVTRKAEIETTASPTPGAPPTHKMKITVNGTADGAAEKLKGINIINALSINAELTANGGEKRIAARTITYDKEGKLDLSGTGDGTNAVEIAKTFNIGDTAADAFTRRAIGQDSINSYYNATMTALGADSSTLDGKIKAHDDIMNQIVSWRTSTSGVDWNEELSNMIKFQKGYSACSRCLTTMDEMLDKLINGTGTVGR